MSEENVAELSDEEFYKLLREDLPDEMFSTEKTLDQIRQELLAENAEKEVPEPHLDCKLVPDEEFYSADPEEVIEKNSNADEL